MQDSMGTIRDGSFTPEFDALVAESSKHWKVPGLSIAVIDNGSVLAKVYLEIFPNSTECSLSQGIWPQPDFWEGSHPGDTLSRCEHDEGIYCNCGISACG